ncbi:unnamed protein product, partial [Cuscuta epithymum]
MYFPIILSDNGNKHVYCIKSAYWSNNFKIINNWFLFVTLCYQPRFKPVNFTIRLVFCLEHPLYSNRLLFWRITICKKGKLNNLFIGKIIAHNIILQTRWERKKIKELEGIFLLIEF